MACVLCLGKTNFTKLVALEDILNLAKFHFAWIVPQNEDLLCWKCWKVLIDFNNYCIEINEIHKISVSPEPISDNKFIYNDVVKTLKTEIEDAVEFKDLEDFTEINCNIDTSIKNLLTQSDIDSENSKKIDDLPVQKPKAKILANTKKTNQAKIKFDEDSDKLIASFMKLKCYVCSISLNKFSELKRHFKTEHNIKNGYMQCCKVRLFKRAQLVDHLNCSHLNPEQLRCTICSKMLSSSYCLKVHMQNCHSDIPKQKQIYTCKECNESFVNHISYHRHLGTHLPVDEWKFKCEKEGCNKTFASNTLLKNHARAHKMKICPECGKAVLANLFGEHLTIHSDKASVTCDICHAIFKTKRYLNVHKSKHLDANTIHQCPTCGKISPNSRALKKHIAYVHNEVKLHKCNVCDKSFKRRYILTQHLAVHTGQPLFNCNYCERTFYWDSHFHAHRKSAHPLEFANEQAKAKAKRTNFKELNYYTKD